MPKLLYDHVTKVYTGAAWPAVDVDRLEIGDGRLVVLLGPSGCGKTTLLKMTNRLVEPTSGSILLDGVELRRSEVTGLRRRMGYVIQQVGLFPHMTVAQNVAVVPDLLGWPRRRSAERVDELLDLVHLPPAEFRLRYPAQLSGGQQQRVGLARALAADPEVLLMDEPFGAIDAITRASLQDEILQLQQRLRKTILFVTHDVDEALRLADEIAVLRAGRVVQFGTPCALLSHPSDDFVRSLLGADDRVRVLGLLRVKDFQRPVTAEEAKLAPEATLSASADMREALSLLLRPGVEQLAVVEEGRVSGWLGMDEIRRAACGAAESLPSQSPPSQAVPEQPAKTGPQA